ncbi:MAG: TRAP transporter large permease subunit, partial [Thermodesulfobacteriota bacterium]|nr:TRAP transporter large permease subunit [Thermodesulfobacteriota bacterium]
LKPVPKEEMPHWGDFLTWSKIVPFSVPIALLIWLLLRGFVLITAGFYASMALIGLYVFSDFSLSGLKKRFVQVGSALSEGGQAVARIVPIMVSVNLLVLFIDLTGVAPKLSGLILEIGGEYLITALLVAAIVPLILGTALPATPSYIIAAAIIAPALIRLGLDIVAVHMFLFYWAALSAVTPPTCTTVIIAANLTGGDWIRVAFVGMKLGIVAFLVPFFFVLEPALLGRGAPIDIVIIALSALIGTFLLASGLSGFMRGKINIFLRSLFTASGILFLYPDLTTSLAGILLAIFAFLGESFMIKRHRMKP